MNRIYRKIFLYSLYIYLGSTFYTRIKDCAFDDFPANILYSLPWDAFPLKVMGDGRSSVSIQTGILSKSEVEDLLRTNSDTFPHVHEGMTLKHIDIAESERDYVVLRFKNTSVSHYGNVKIYYTNFPGSINQYVFLFGRGKKYHNIVLPYPQFSEQESHNLPEVSIRWKNFWGS